MAAFTPGNIVVYRVGGSAGTGSAAGGSATLTNASTQVFLDEFRPDGTFVQSIALPSTAGSTNPLTSSGSATSEGELTLSGNGTTLLVPGYDVATGTASVASTTATAVPREVGLVNANGTVDTMTVLTGFESGNNIRSAASANGTAIYAGGPNSTTGGIDLVTADTTTPTSIDTAANVRQIEVVGGQVYYSMSGTGGGIFALGGGTPTTGQQTGTLVPGTGSAGTNPYGFFFAKLSAGSTGNDTLYIADQTAGIEKFSLQNGTFVLTGTIAPSGSNGLTGVTGLTGKVNNDGSVSLYATSPTSLVSITDSSGFNGTLAATSAPASPAVLATAPPNTAFRGDAFAPQAAAPCFATGTRIRTARGDVAVEALVVGDLAVTSSGALRPIRWIGHRRTDCRHHPRPREIMPVRIAANAFGAGRPSRDLVVSPGHAICVDAIGEVLIPAGALVNGMTIVQESVDAVTYWHVELESHDVLLAENLPAESYLDMGNRVFFEENGVLTLHGSPDAVVPTHADFCRPFHGDGPMVEAVRARLYARAARLGWRLRWDTGRMSEKSAAA